MERHLSSVTHAHLLSLACAGRMTFTTVEEISRRWDATVSPVGTDCEASRPTPGTRAVQTTDVLVIGGGVIGLAVAWRCAQWGMRTMLLERHRLGGGASRVAAGMLAPVAELELGEAGERTLRLGLQAERMWPAFAAELAQESGEASSLRSDGTLIAAHGRDQAEALERELAFRLALGLDAKRLRPSEARLLEPALAPTLQLAVSLPGERSVAPRRLTGALAVAARRAGATLREGVEVRGVLRAAGRAQGAALVDGSRIVAGAVVVAAGAWSSRFGAVAVRPVKGQIMRLSDPAGPGLISRALRFEGGYIVPRGDGRYVLGATMEEQGFDDAVTAGAAHRLLRDASQSLPGVLEMKIEELTAGFRPGTPDNAPIIGLGDLDGLVWATGHYRNGILLAPITAQLVLEELGRATARQVGEKTRSPTAEPVHA